MTTEEREKAILDKAHELRDQGRIFSEYDLAELLEEDVIIIHLIMGEDGWIKIDGHMVHEDDLKEDNDGKDI